MLSVCLFIYLCGLFNRPVKHVALCILQDSFVDRVID